MAHALGMDDSLLRYEGGGHTAFFQGITCVDAAIETYLIDLRLPLPGATCPALPVSFGPAARARSGQSGATLDIDTGFWSGLPGRVPGVGER